MAQFDVHRYKSRDKTIKYAVVLQHDVLSRLTTCVVAPLRTEYRPFDDIARVEPPFVVANERLVMATHQVASVPLAQLGVRVGSLKEERDRIIAAIYFLFTGT